MFSAEGFFYSVNNIHIGCEIALPLILRRYQNKFAEHISGLGRNNVGAL